MEVKFAQMNFAISGSQSNVVEQPCSSESYEFINSSSDPGIPPNKEARQLIRKQAMSRVAAARRQTGTWGRQNRRQYPVSRLDAEEHSEAEDEASAATSARADSSQQRQGLVPMTKARTAVPASFPSSGYESMRVNYGFDILDVSALTTFQAGRVTAQLLSRTPLRLAHVLRCRQWSYLSFLPSRYGQSACLDNAAHCVAARMRQWIRSPSDPPCYGVLSLYSKCLTSLQSALNDPILCLKPEVLCAIALLGIYEVNRLSYHGSDYH